MCQNGQTCFKNLEVFLARFLKFVRPFWDTALKGLVIDLYVANQRNVVCHFQFFVIWKFSFENFSFFIFCIEKRHRKEFRTKFSINIVRNLVSMLVAYNANFNEYFYKRNKSKVFRIFKKFWVLLGVTNCGVLIGLCK